VTIALTVGGWREPSTRPQVDTSLEAAR